MKTLREERDEAVGVLRELLRCVPMSDEYLWWLQVAARIVEREVPVAIPRAWLEAGVTRFAHARRPVKALRRAS